MNEIANNYLERKKQQIHLCSNAHNVDYRWHQYMLIKRRLLQFFALKTCFSNTNNIVQNDFM